MPNYKQSKSQKRSQSQSKNGGRRRKHTVRKLRRGKKSRKVMRGGADKISYDKLEQMLNADGLMNDFLLRYNNVRKQKVNTFQEFKDGYDQNGKVIRITEFTSMIGLDENEIKLGTKMARLVLTLRTMVDE